MKRLITILFLASVLFIVWFLLKNPNTTQNSSVVESTKTNLPVSQSVITSSTPTAIIQQASISTAMQLTNIQQATLNPLRAQNIEEWKAAIPGLHNDSAITNNWTLWQSNTNAGVPFVMGDTNLGLIELYANMVNIYTRRDGSGNVRRVEIHSVWMNIEDTKSFGDSLLQLMGKDKAGFDAWCNEVGNRWVDQPQFSSGNANVPDNAKAYSFQTWPTFNNDRPWCIVLTVADR